MIEKDKIRAGLYVRVSTEAQAEEGYSIQAQSDRLVSYCKAMGIKNYALYVDGGYSGSNIDRPKIKELIEDAKNKKINSVVVYKLDRLSRSQKDTLYLIEDVFLPNDVDFVSLNESIDTSTPYGRAMIGILSAFAQLERENIYMRTRMGMLERVKKGLWMGGGNIPYGYRYDRNQGILVPFPEEAENVRKMYDLYIKGYSPQKIADMFGIKYDRTVSEIISRKSNLGIISYNGEEYQGQHEPIVSEDIFYLAQREMRERSERHRVTEKADHLLTGLIYCGDCGARMRYIKWGKSKDGKDKFKLVCYSYDKGKKHMHKSEECSLNKFWAREIEELVLNDLFQISADLKDSKKYIQDELVSPIKLLEEQISQLEKKIKVLYNLYASDNDDLLLQAIDENKKLLAELKSSYEDEKKNHRQECQLNFILDELINIRDTWDFLSSRKKQMFIRDCIEKIVIYNDEIKIHYTFINDNKGSSNVA